MDYLMDIIKKRKSIRVYHDKPLPENMLSDIMEAAKNAPTARNAQQLEYKVVTSRAMLQKLSDCVQAFFEKYVAAMPNRPPSPPSGVRLQAFHRAPCLILICGPKDNDWIETDASLGAQNIMLYAASRDLGSCFIGMARLLTRDAAIMKELNISDNQKIAAAVVVGYPNENPAPKEKFLKVEYFK
jgi:nitroreductase